MKMVKSLFFVLGSRKIQNLHLKNATRKPANDLTLCKETSKRVTKRLNFIINKKSLLLALPIVRRLLTILSANSNVVRRFLI